MSPNLRLRAIEGLENKWKQLKLSEVEGNEILIDEDLLLEKIRMGSKSLVGKLHSFFLFFGRRHVSSILKAPSTRKFYAPLCSRFGKLPNLSQSMKYVPILMYLVLKVTWISRVLSRRPWLFDSALLSLKPFDGITLSSKMVFTKKSFWVQLHNLSLACMNEDVGRQVGDTIGVVKDYDVQEDALAGGRSSECTKSWTCIN